jgi:hypothetical protein
MAGYQAAIDAVESVKGRVQQSKGSE